MAKGYFRVDDTICLYCGHTDIDESGCRKAMPYKTGSRNNPAFLCPTCAGRTKEGGGEVRPHKARTKDRREGTT